MRKSASRPALSPKVTKEEETEDNQEKKDRRSGLLKRKTVDAKLTRPFSVGGPAPSLSKTAPTTPTGQTSTSAFEALFARRDSDTLSSQNTSLWNRKLTFRELYSIDDHSSPYQPPPIQAPENRWKPANPEADQALLEWDKCFTDFEHVLQNAQEKLYFDQFDLGLGVETIETLHSVWPESFEAPDLPVFVKNTISMFSSGLLVIKRKNSAYGGFLALTKFIQQEKMNFAQASPKEKKSPVSFTPKKTSAVTSTDDDKDHSRSKSPRNPTETPFSFDLKVVEANLQGLASPRGKGQHEDLSGGTRSRSSSKKRDQKKPEPQEGSADRTLDIPATQSPRRDSLRGKQRTDTSISPISSPRRSSRAALLDMTTDPTTKKASKKTEKASSENQHPVKDKLQNTQEGTLDPPASTGQEVLAEQKGDVVNDCERVPQQDPNQPKNENENSEKIERENDTAQAMGEKSADSKSSETTPVKDTDADPKTETEDSNQSSKKKKRVDKQKEVKDPNPAKDPNSKKSKDDTFVLKSPKSDRPTSSRGSRYETMGATSTKSKESKHSKTESPRDKLAHKSGSLGGLSKHIEIKKNFSKPRAERGSAPAHQKHGDGEENTKSKKRPSQYGSPPLNEAQLLLTKTIMDKESADSVESLDFEKWLEKTPLRELSTKLEKTTKKNLPQFSEKPPVNILSHFQGRDRTKPTNKAEIGTPFLPPNVSSYQVEFLSLHSCLTGFQDPFWCIAAVYDVSKKTKITEDFSFDWNHDHELLVSLLRLDLSTTLPNTMAKRCRFDLNSVNSSTFVVVKLYCALRGEIDSICEPYIKGQLGSVEVRTSPFGTLTFQHVKWMESIRGSHKQFMAWCFFPLKEHIGAASFSVSFNRGRALFTDESIYELLETPDSKSRIKPLDISLEVQVKPSSTPLTDQYLVDTSLFPVGATADPTKPRIKQLHCFTRPTLGPHLQYENNLYIYPQLFNLSSFPSKIGKLKNIAVQISVACGDEIIDLSQSGTKCLYSRFGSGEEFTQTIRLPIIWDAKRLIMGDEIKMRIPLIPDPALHLRILFINLAKDKREKTMSETVLGFSSLPIWDENNVILADGDHHIFICPRDVGPGYLSRRDYIDPLKVNGLVVTKLVSSIYTQDLILNEFFSKAENLSEIDGKILKKIVDASPNEILRNFHRILDQLTSIMCWSPSQNIQQLSFRAFVSIMKLVQETKAEDTTELLRSYVNFHACTKDDNRHEKFTTHFNVLISEAGISTEAGAVLANITDQIAEFIFRTITRSTTLQINAKSLLESQSRSANFSNAFKKALAELANSLGGLSVVSKPFNAQIGIFFYDLLDVMDRGTVFDMINAYLSGSRITPNRLRFLKIVCDHPHYVPLNLPQFTQVHSSKTLRLHFWKNHYLAGHILNEISLTCSTTSSRTQEQDRVRSVRLLRNVILKHDAENRYSEKTPLANLYIPFIQLMVKNVKILVSEESDSEEKSEWFTVMLWILGNCERTLIQQWWSLCSIQERENILKLFITCLDQASSSPMIFPTIEIFCLYLSEYCVDFHTALLTHRELLKQMSYLLRKTHVLSLKQENTYLMSCRISTTFFETFRVPLFSELEATTISEWTSTIMQSLTSADLPAPNKKHGTDLLFTLIKTDYLQNHHLLIMKMALTVAHSKLEKSQYSQFQSILDVILELSKTDSTEGWSFHITDILGRLYRITEISKRSDHESNLENLLVLCQESNHSVGQRVYWLNKAAELHIKEASYELAAQCKIIVAALINATIHKLNPIQTYLPVDFQPYSRIAPNILQELPVYKSCLFEPLSTDIFSISGYIATLETAAQYFTSGYLYECASDTLRLLSDLYRNTGEWNCMNDVALRIATLSTQVFEANETTSRLFTLCYRVCFYGAKFGHLANQAYIYRRPQAIRLAEVQSDLLISLSKQLGEEIKILPNKQKDRLEIDPAAHYIQVVAVEALPTPKITQRALTPFEKQHDCNSFSFELPYVPKDGKASEDVDKQYKLHTVCQTKHYFPFVSPRLKVIKEIESIISPIDSAIDLITTRVEALRAELNPGKSPNTKTLQIVLQGSIMLQVNAGPLAICRTFFAKESEFSDHPKIPQLKQLLREFIVLCGAALKLNGHLITQEQEAYQVAMEKSYKQLQAETRHLLDDVSDEL